MEFRYIGIITVLIMIFLTVRVLKRMKSKGCVSFIYVGLVVFSILSLFFGSISMLIGMVGRTFNCVFYGEHHTVKVVDYDSYVSHDSETGDRIMYTPIVEFRDNSGKIIRKELEFSTGGEVLGKTYNVLYNAKDGQILTLGFTLVISFFGVILFSFILGGLSIGIFLYAMNQPMVLYWKKVGDLGLGILLPTLMIGFEALLIYGLFYGEKVPIYVTALLIFFIIVLGFVIWLYLKNIINNGVPKFKRVSSNTWTSD